jgi:hypothetical protein
VVNHLFHVVYRFLNVQLALFKEAPSLVTGCQIVVGDYVIDLVQHLPVFYLLLRTPLYLSPIHTGLILLVELVKEGIHNLCETW